MEAAAKEKPAASTWATTSPAERVVLQYQVEQFLYQEAALLDARRYRDWLDLLAEDMHYWMPIRRTMTTANVDREFTARGDMAFFDDTRELLVMRVNKLEAGSAWSEDPPSRARHTVSNVRITDVVGDEITLDMNFHLYRARLNTEEDIWCGRRVDGLRRNGDSFLFTRRDIYLDQTLIKATNMSTIF
ncbi:3-phenylpropionate/cinnamic acid dioxygenase subunit beta [Phenylobacterium sp.]|uniref:aromatic-ring-hydroxylating dioxygenase subunit beta n=1 Tax=Phenylobacterium sp. TaxID=1871053 RepID=UPI0035B3AC57